VPYSPEEVSGDEDNQLTAAIQVLNGSYDPAQAALSEEIPVQ
jgi:hypothetical protein